MAICCPILIMESGTCEELVHREKQHFQLAVCFSGEKLAIANILFWLTCAEKDPKCPASSGRETRISEHLPAHLFHASACTTQPNYHRLSPYWERYSTSVSKCNVFQSLMFCSDWQLAITVYHFLVWRCVLISMNILPDVSHNVQCAAGPFEHLLTTKILNWSTEHWLWRVGASQTNQVWLANRIYFVIIPPVNIHMGRREVCKGEH